MFARNYASFGILGSLLLLILVVNWFFMNVSKDSSKQHSQLQNREDEQKPLIFDSSSKLTNKHLGRTNSIGFVKQMQQTQRRINMQIRKEFSDPYIRWRLLHPLFDIAMSGFRYFLPIFELKNRDETKHFLEFSNPNTSCNFVTLGVGKDWSIEKAMRQKYPQCEFMGVDPVKENREIVEAEPNSRFVLGAVSDTVGNESAYILDDKYVDRKISHRAFVELLATDNKGKLIDFLSIDIEGPEFVLLKELHNQRSKLPVICQINVKIHYGLDGQSIQWEKIYDTLSAIFEESHFICPRFSRIPEPKVGRTM